MNPKLKCALVLVLFLVIAAILIFKTTGERNTWEKRAYAAEAAMQTADEKRDAYSRVVKTQALELQQTQKERDIYKQQAEEAARRADDATRAFQAAQKERDACKQRADNAVWATEAAHKERDVYKQRAEGYERLLREKTPSKGAK